MRIPAPKTTVARPPRAVSAARRPFRCTATDGKSDSRTRQQIEEAYYAEWERLTLVPEEELNRPMTVATFSKFVPTWLRYNALPGPVRYWLFKDKLADESSSGGDKE